MSKTGFQAFAAGMIVATSVLGGTYLLTDEKPVTANTEEKEITDKDVSSYLTGKGQVAITTDEYEELLKTKDAALKQQTKAEKETQPAQQAEKPVSYTFRINAGMTTSEISEILEQNGIVADSFDFDQYLIKNKYHQKVQLGTFTVQKGMNYQQLAELLTK